jgi:HAD superfamily hydrolase (TIGR01490 family)
LEASQEFPELDGRVSAEKPPVKRVPPHVTPAKVVDARRLTGMTLTVIVIPARAGIRGDEQWVPAFAGTTAVGQSTFAGRGGNLVRIAFYDFDGTLARSNIVVRYAFYARRFPSRVLAAYRTTKLLLSVPFLIGLDLYSRSLFNRVFFRQYAGMKAEWLTSSAEAMFEEVILPSIFPAAPKLMDEDRRQGHRLVLLSGELDFALRPVVRYLGFDQLVANSLEFKDGVATGRILPPLVAEQEKVAAIQRICGELGAEAGECKAYSDSSSDLPMLEAVGHPAAVNPDRRLKRVAKARGWPVVDLKKR